MEKFGKIDLKGYKRSCNWTHLEKDSKGFDIVLGYVPEAITADVRILTKANPRTLIYDDYFQLSYINADGVKDFKSIRMYNDEEINRIADNIPNLAFFHTM